MTTSRHGWGNATPPTRSASLLRTTSPPRWASRCSTWPIRSGRTPRSSPTWSRVRTTTSSKSCPATAADPRRAMRFAVGCSGTACAPSVRSISPGRAGASARACSCRPSWVMSGTSSRARRRDGSSADVAEPARRRPSFSGGCTRCPMVMRRPPRRSA